MAVDRADKENLPPVAAQAAAAAVARLHVKICKQKRLGRARRRVPLRDITNLLALEPAVAQWQQTLTLLQQPREGSATAEPAVKKGLAGGAGSKAGRYSLRKEFR
uniref:Uncharacterized protein n=1 Tax=Avena sativa TaxID=4498 RepID=A0ACD5X8B3_AVESA